MTTRAEWALDLLTAGSWPTSQEHTLALVAWQSAEDTGAEWNPLATTEPAPGTSNFNSVGVKNYPTLQEGIEATLATLHNGDYPHIIGALADPNSTAEAICEAVAGSPWGTGQLAVRMVAPVRGDFGQYASRQVTGPSAPPPGSPPPVGTGGDLGPVTVTVPELREGADEVAVKSVQALLNRAGGHLLIDGAFGPLTAEAVRQYQSAKGLAADGVVGPVTWSTLIVR